MADEAKKEEELETPKKENPEKEEIESPETPVKEDKEIETEKEGGSDKLPDDGDKKPDLSESGKRTPRLMEMWQHEVAEKNWGKEKESLQHQIEDLTGKLESKSSPDRETAIREFGKKMFWEDDLTNEFVKIMSPDGSLKKELEDLKSAYAKDKESRTWELEDKAFEKDFDANVKSLLEADELSEEMKERAKKLLKAYAFSEKYAKTPLSVIYKGVDDFRQLDAKGKKSGENSRGGFRGKEGDVNILEMDDESFNKYIDSEKKKAGKFQIRRDGQDIS